jgi:hypothetical protein
MDEDARRLAAHDIGCDLDDALEAVRKEALRHEGGKEALLHALKGVQSLLARAEQDQAQGEFDADVAGWVGRYIDRAAESLKNVQLNTEARALVVQGQVQGLESAVKIVKSHYDGIARGLDHPGPTLKTQRQGEHASNT